MKLRTVSISFLILLICIVKIYAQVIPIDPDNFDLTYNPGDNFYLYANGTWIKNNPVPPDKSRYGSFDVLAEENYVQLKDILESAASDLGKKHGDNKQKIGDFYVSGMNTEKIEKEGVKPLLEDFEKIDNLKDKIELIKLISFYHSNGVFPLFNVFVAPDQKNSQFNILLLSQGGIGLSDRDYYFKEDERSKLIREEYKKHLKRMFILIGENETTAEKMSESVYEIEKNLASNSRTRLELRNPEKNYNKMDINGLKNLASDFDWDLYFNEIGVKELKEINIRQPEFFQGLNVILNSADVEDLKYYLKWQLLRNYARYLSSDFENENFNFYSGVMSGVKEMKPRWKRVLDVINGNMGEALGQLYVEKYFPAKAKTRMLEMVSNMREAFKQRIENLSWMSPETKAEAMEKLKKIDVKIGYPDKWKDFSTLEISSDSYIENARRSSNFWFKRSLNKLYKPVDRTEWGMSPQTVNAYYSPTQNEIVFPAGILQPPFFFADGDDAVNYGGIGVVICHEMTHGFDDQGRKYDKEGNMKDWWTQEDAEKFEKQTSVLIEQYNNYKILDSLHVDGKLTLGENIADLGGVMISLTALNNQLGEKINTELIDGFTPLQRFFLSYSQVWRQNIREKELMRRLKEDVHSPGEARVNGIVYNVPEFYQAFRISPESYRFIIPENRAVIW